MPRYKCTIEYDGLPFVGWQEQANGSSVQGALQLAIFKFSGETVSVRGAGRTDTGVHALGQVAHFDLSKDWQPHRVRDAINFHLKPAPVAITKCEEAHPDFDARFSATRRRYRYKILSRRSPAVLDRGRVWWVPFELDSDAMAAACSVLIGKHDFTTFRAAACQAASPIKTLDELTVRRDGDVISIDTSARSFLHNQVRSMAGSLKLVGEGRWSKDDLYRALTAADRAACGTVAPPEGLCLLAVEYS